MKCFFLICATIALFVSLASAAKPDTQPRSPVAVGHPTFVSPHASPIAVGGRFVFVVNTPSDTVDVINTGTRKIVARVNVGIDPVGIAVRPDGKEVWVSNHVSDSVSVIDNDPSSPTYLNVVATVQEFDRKAKSTRFDEPVGIAFASNEKAYVALSSENQIAVVDVATRKVTKRLTITAQDPRAIVVRNERLYVIPFESNNKTQLSGGNKIDGDLVTFNAWEHSVLHNNVLSLGHVVDIVKHPRVPDRDLYVFDTKTDELVETVDTLGTLLYGLTVDSKGRVFIAQTDARNDASGRSGSKKHGLKELGNRAFLNQITKVDFDAGSDGKPEFINLEPLPPKQPAKGDSLATPFAIEISSDDSTLIATAAGSDKLFTIDAASGEILGRVNVGAVPRGIALENSENGKSTRAWVLNAVANTVSLVDVSDPSNLQVQETFTLEDPTHPTVKRGRIAFNTAAASTTQTYSCASCHPDGHTDQLLWVLKTPIVTGGDQIMPRSTMPIRGLRDTEPYHWDGIPGDPYGGNNSGNIHGSDPPNSKVGVPTTSTRHLIDGGLAATMMMVGDETVNDEGKAGALTAAQRDDMATFLLSVPYPPAQRRAYDNVVSDRAEQGFKLFHIDGDLDDKVRPNVCGNCHRMPFLVSTNTPGTGMDAPTWRGAYDRFLILPQGRLNIIDFDFYARVAEQGIPERNVWQFSWAGRRRFDPVWEMVLEGSTGFSGSLGRQVTLNSATATNQLSRDLLSALELSASEAAIILEGDGVLIDDPASQPVTLRFDSKLDDSTYVSSGDDGRAFTREELFALATNGKFVGTFTARHGANSDVDHPQPAIWTRGPIERQRGRQQFPTLYDGNDRMKVSGRHIHKDAFVIVDGRRVAGSVSLENSEKVEIALASLPPVGMHLLQIQNPDGLFSNDFIFHVTKDAEAAAELKRQADRAHRDVREVMPEAIANGDLEHVKRILNRAGRRINERQPSSGSTALSTAAFHDKIDIAKLLIRRGANVETTNRDGNTPLLVAAFMCRREMVQLLLEKGASPLTKNGRGETPIDAVSSPWTKQLAAFYTGINNVVPELKFDLERIERERPKMAKLLRDHVEQTKNEKEE
jgi:YVTN family beta-propeller protein